MIGKIISISPDLMIKAIHNKISHSPILFLKLIILPPPPIHDVNKTAADLCDQRLFLITVN
ncbi:hypothetical protein BH11BAC1_BH11BAC1_19590 [soil metagenome]